VNAAVSSLADENAGDRQGTTGAAVFSRE